MLEEASSLERRLAVVVIEFNVVFKDELAIVEVDDKAVVVAFNVVLKDELAVVGVDGKVQTK